MLYRKAITLSDLKFDTEGEGTFTAVFATLNVVDNDGDITMPGAFGEQSVKISQYNHGSWGDGAEALPIGVGKIFEQGDNAIVAGEFDMEDADAVKTYKKLKYLHEKGHTQEWSYALPDVDYEFREVDGRRVRALKRISVPEVSPVLMGAGVNTRMLSIKSGKPFADQVEDVLADIQTVIERATDIKKLRKSKGKAIGEDTVERLRGLAAACKSASDELAGVLDSSHGEDTAAQAEYLKFLQFTQTH